MASTSQRNDLTHNHPDLRVAADHGVGVLRLHASTMISFIRRFGFDLTQSSPSVRKTVSYLLAKARPEMNHRIFGGRCG